MRFFLPFLLGLIVIVLSSATYAEGKNNLNQDEFLENSAGKFAVDIPGAPTASKNIHSVHVEDLTIDVREETCGENWDFRTYASGDTHFGSVTLKSKVDKNSKELLQWFMDASVGKNVRKNISIVLKDRDGDEARRWILHDAFPIKYDPGDYSPSSTVGLETIVVKIGRVELDSDDNSEKSKNENGDHDSALSVATKQDKKQIIKGFRIEVSGPSGVKHVDTTWVSATGGAIVFQPPLTLDTIPIPDTIPSINQPLYCDESVGHKYVEEIVLRGPMTSSRTWIAENINDVVKGKFSTFDLTLVEIGKDGQDVRRYTYEDCFVTRYVYPKLSADGTGNLYEEVSIKPERLDLA
jgi:phage tail-like protein